MKQEDVHKKVLSKIDAALTIVNLFPELNNINLNASVNPFDFLMDLFKHTSGYDKVINILSHFIAHELPLLEITVKGVVLSNLKNIISCSINPFITDELLKNGIMFNINNIDITDTLKYNPLSDIGKYFYFDNENVSIPDDLKKSEDFNSFLWYVVNKSVSREVWGRTTDISDNAGINDKQTKNNGIITLEFNKRSTSIKDSEGNNMNVQTPYNDCLHVFIGNTKEVYNDKVNDAYNEDVSIQKDSLFIQELINKININKEIFKNNEKELNDNYKKGIINSENYNEYIKIIKDKKNFLDYLYNYDFLNENNEYIFQNKKYSNLNEIITDVKKLISIIDNINILSIEELMLKFKDINNINNIEHNFEIYRNASYNKMFGETNSNLLYRDITKNYYYKKTLIEFNTDYVMSLKLFDEKVITSQLIDQLTSVLSMDLGLSYKEQVIKFQIKKMIKDIVNSDDIVVSDCFFSFNNDDLDNQLKKSELNKENLFSINGEENLITKINAKDILSKINGINKDASKETIQSIIDNGLIDISKEVSRDSFKTTNNFNVQMNFIEKLMDNLAYVIVHSVISPKLYLLLLINITIMGENTTLNIDYNISKFRQIIASIIREIRDQLIIYLFDKLMDLLNEVIERMTVKLTAEQAWYYKRLMSQLIEAYNKYKRKSIDIKLDDVDYADIYETSEKPKNNEC